MAHHLILRLEGPVVAFGAPIIDNFGVVQEWPGASLLTGLIANALGWRRTEAARHQRLQDRLVFGVRRDREGVRIRDFQTAALDRDDRGWTTRGEPEGRSGGPATYEAPHIRYRDYDADACLCVAMRLQPIDEAPTLDDVAAALDQPARPLFLGRKPCVPANPIKVAIIEAASVHEALAAYPLLVDRARQDQDWLTGWWPPGEGPEDAATTARMEIADLRNWISGVHAGSRTLIRGRIQGPLPE